ncbi:MAG TPA: Ig domain-containing protein [Blastocatellia bacterium]|nr:Ig domain-containing protein [Blastocatellia bacterium]
MKHACFGLLFFLIALFVLSTSASAQSTFLTLYSQPGDDFGGRPNPNGRAFNYGELDGSWQVLGRDFDGDGLAEDVLIFFVPTDTSVSFWRIRISTRGLGVNMSPGYYDMTSELGYPLLNVSRGFGCTRSSGTFTILDAKFDYSDRFHPAVVSFAAKFAFYCGGTGPAGLLGTVYYRSSAVDLGSGPVLISNSSSLPDWEVGQSSSLALPVEGGVPPYTWNLQSGSLPPGLSLASNGVLSGTPTQTGAYEFDVIVNDSVNIPTSNAHRAQAHLSLKVVDPPPLSIGDQVIPGGLKGQNFSYQLIAKGGAPPYKWSITGGQLPSGLNLDAVGKLSGIPTSAGTFNFTVQVTDDSSTSAQRSYVLKVVDPPRISKVKYKAGKGKLTISGDLFANDAKVYIDGNEIKLNSHDAESLSAKKVFLPSGDHEVRVVNPDGGIATAEFRT